MAGFVRKLLRSSMNQTFEDNFNPIIPTMITPRNKNSVRVILFSKKAISAILMNIIDTAVQIVKAIAVGMLFIAKEKK